MISEINCWNPFLVVEGNFYLNWILSCFLKLQFFCLFSSSEQPCEWWHNALQAPLLFIPVCCNFAFTSFLAWELDLLYLWVIKTFSKNIDACTTLWHWEEWVNLLDLDIIIFKNGCFASKLLAIQGNINAKLETWVTLILSQVNWRNFTIDLSVFIPSFSANPVLQFLVAWA